MLQGIAALVAAVGAIVLFGLKVILDRQDERRRREERIDDLVRAVEADIAVERGRLDAAFGPEHAGDVKAALIANIEERRPKPMPRSPSGSASLVLDTLRREISLLPGNSIEPVIRFYRLNQGVDALSDAFTKSDYDDLGPDRQRAAIERYFSSGALALEAAHDALRALTRSRDAAR